MRKINKKTIFFIFCSITVIGIVCIVIVFKSLNPFKPIFYNYSGYADKKTIKNINSKFTYKEYASANEFEYNFNNDRVIAGIGSDYSIINLINNKKISPISYEIKKINNLDQNTSWESYFSDVAVEQMRFYDKFISNDVQVWLNKNFPEYGSNYQFRFSDFIVPYFINDRVIAYNTKKILNQSNVEIDFKSKYPSLVFALNTLWEQDNNLKIQWTQNEIENAVIGNTINEPKEWNTKIDNDNWASSVDNFSLLVQEGTKAKMNNHNRNLFTYDSDVILNNLVNPDSTVDVGIMYNGDALDAYYSNDNVESVKDGEAVRVTRTKYNIRVLDSFVISSSLSKNERYEALKFFNENLFNGMFDSKEKISTFDNVYQTKGILRIFDYVNYTPAARGAYEYILDNYFIDEDGNVDTIAIDIFTVPLSNDQIIIERGIEPINKEIQSKLVARFQEKLNGF